MERILVSWIALENDFVKGRAEVNTDGPTANIHKHFFDYDNHYLLTTAKAKIDDTRLEFLLSYLNRKYNHSIKPVFLDISDVIDIKEIKSKVSEFLLSKRKCKIEIFISPGTPAMQVAWYFAHYELGLNTTLFQVRPAKFTKENKPKRVDVDIEQSSFTSSIIIKEQMVDEYDEPEIKITPSIKPVFDLAYKIASTDRVRTLITGETGTGKEILARHIHNSSARSKHPFVPINCSALGDELLESRLFGHLKGAFTGAIRGSQGAFQDAEDGTIFLDEIGDISPKMQQTLLRVLQEKKVSRIGTTKEKDINVRIIAATNKDLISLCEEGQFRYDLYYRLAVAELRMPSLRERKKGEVRILLKFLINKKQKEFNKPKLKLQKDVENFIVNYSFPGNVREMENLIERLYVYTDGKVTMDDLPDRIINNAKGNSASLKLIDVGNHHIQKVLAMFPDNKQQVCRVLGISRNTLGSRIKKYNL